VDSDNTGSVDRSQYEDDEEMKDPGVVIWFNIDDDNGNGVQDRSDPGPFVNPQGQPVDDVTVHTPESNEGEGWWAR